MERRGRRGGRRQGAPPQAGGARLGPACSVVLNPLVRLPHPAAGVWGRTPAQPELPPPKAMHDVTVSAAAAVAAALAHGVAASAFCRPISWQPSCVNLLGAEVAEKCSFPQQAQHIALHLCEPCRVIFSVLIQRILHAIFPRDRCTLSFELFSAIVEN